MTTFLIVLAVLIAAAFAYVRLAPLPGDRIGRAGETREVGTYPTEGGFTAVVEVAEGAAALAALRKVALDTPRTEALSEADAAVQSFVTRSRIWGFPDITNAWIAEGRLHVSAHLVYGRKDFDVNRSRVEAWLERANLRS